MKSQKKNKVVCYFLRTNNERLELLVFDHRDQPEALTQVVGGTVEDNESLILAMIREIKEESGLLVKESDLHYVGKSIYRRKDREEINERDYFLVYHPRIVLPDYFEHLVKSSGEDDAMVFCFYWINVLDAEKKLTGNFHEKIVEASALYQQLSQ